MWMQNYYDGHVLMVFILQRYSNPKRTILHFLNGEKLGQYPLKFRSVVVNRKEQYIKYSLCDLCAFKNSGRI